MAAKGKITKIYNNFCEYMKNDTKGIEFGIYAASGILFSVAYYKTRPITKFGKPSDLPKYFIKNKLKQCGTIAGIDPNSKSGPLLLINHKPPLYFLIPSNKLLPVKLTGISVNSNGYSWLQTVAVGHNVEFIPIYKDHENVECQVFMMCPKNKKKELDMSDTLLSLGFGKIADLPRELKDVELQRYFKELLKTEARAKANRSGFWLEILPPQPWLQKVVKGHIHSLLLRTLPSNRRLPDLVR